MTDTEFDNLIAKAMDELPQEYITGLDNVAIVIADNPTPDQHSKMHLDGQHLLLGLYEGIPLTKRGIGYNFVLPDKITLFKNQIMAVCSSDTELFEQVKRTLWHEIAHYYGLDHDRIDLLQSKDKQITRR